MDITSPGEKSRESSRDHYVHHEHSPHIGECERGPGTDSRYHHKSGSNECDRSMDITSKVGKSHESSQDCYVHCEHSPHSGEHERGPGTDSRSHHKSGSNEFDRSMDITSPGEKSHESSQDHYVHCEHSPPYYEHYSSRHYSASSTHDVRRSPSPHHQHPSHGKDGESSHHPVHHEHSLGYYDTYHTGHYSSSTHDVKRSPSPHSHSYGEQDLESSHDHPGEREHESSDVCYVRHEHSLAYYEHYCLSESCYSASTHDGRSPSPQCEYSHDRYVYHEHRGYYEHSHFSHYSSSSTLGNQSSYVTKSPPCVSREHVSYKVTEKVRNSPPPKNLTMKVVM